MNRHEIASTLSTAVDDLREAIRFLQRSEPGYDGRDADANAATLMTDVEHRTRQAYAALHRVDNPPARPRPTLPMVSTATARKHLVDASHAWPSGEQPDHDFRSITPRDALKVHESLHILGSDHEHAS